MSSACQQQFRRLHAPLPVQREQQGRTYQRGSLNDEAQTTQCARQRVKDCFKIARLFLRYKAEVSHNKYDIAVMSEPEADDETICLEVHEIKKLVPMTVKNLGSTAVNFSFEAFKSIKSVFTITDSHGKVIGSIKNHTLEPGESYAIKIHFHSRHSGFFDQLLVFSFETHQPSPESFKIIRLLEINLLKPVCDTPLPTTADQSSSSDQDFGRLQIGERLEEVEEQRQTETERLPRKDLIRLEMKVFLRKYTIPKWVKNQAMSERMLREPLKWENYTQRFKLLLHLEELQQQCEADTFFLQSVPMFSHSNRNGEVYMVQVPLRHMNPASNLSTYLVEVTLLPQQEVFSKQYYMGSISHLEENCVYLHFKPRPQHFKSGMNVRMQFIIKRTSLRLCHRAAALVNIFKLEEVLFPTRQLSSHNSCLPRLENKSSNPEQHTAVRHIVAATAKPAPYLVFGPPCTGKTLTLVRAIREIVNIFPDCNILACTPSNSAADHLYERLLEEGLGFNQVYRFYGFNYWDKNMDCIKKFNCNFDPKRRQMMLPSRMELMQYQIMVTTLSNAGRLVTGGVPQDHYSYIFVDNAGQATEPGCIIPLSGLFKHERCQVVLAGDPKQLGPKIESRLAEKYGLGLSFLERLMNHIDLYKRHETHGYNKRFVTKLLRNYRSHPAILKVPSELFYGGELQPYASREKCTSYCDWEFLPKKGFPVIFHGVAGTDQFDENCNSFYNMAEVEVLMTYLKALIKRLHRRGVTEIEANEIGIISPYRKQVEKIQKALKSDKDLCQKEMENIMVATVEKFQGKESQVILVSAVCSNLALNDPKLRFSLGIVQDEKRFNVVMTRAQALLIVIGDPRTLKTDPLWNKFIQYCYNAGGYRGIPMCDRVEEEESSTDKDAPSSW